MDKQEQPGSVERALAGDYDFSIGDIINESVQCIDGYKMPFAIITSVFFVMYIVVVILVNMLFPAETAPAVMQVAGLLFTPMSATIMMTGLVMVKKGNIETGSLFAHYDKFVPLVLMQLAITILLVIGFVLLILPGIYLMFCYTFAIPLMLDRKMDVIEAMETSRKAVTTHWFQFFALWLVMFVVVFISAIPFGIGLFWTMPMMVAMIGILYKRIFGFAEDDKDTAVIGQGGALQA